MKEVVAGQDGSYVKAHELTFDAARIQQELQDLIASQHLPLDKTYCLKHRGEASSVKEQLLDFPGSLGRIVNGIADVFQRDFRLVTDGLKGSYTEHVIQVITDLSPFPIGRVRWAYLKPKTAYSLHIDNDPVRFHVPLKTDIKKVFFVVDDLVFRMPEVGRLYSLRVNVPHSAINAQMREERIHLLFDTYHP